MDPLQEIPSQDWPSLLTYLMSDWPKSFIIISWMRSRSSWIKKTAGSSDYRFHILAPEGNVQNGLVTFGRVGRKSYYFTLYLFKKCTNKIENALLNTNLINWDDNYVCGVPTGYEKWFKGILRKKGYQVHHDTPTHYYRIPKEAPETYKIKCPDDVYVDLLKQEDVLKVNQLWQHKFEGSHDLISECIRLNYGYGVYSKKSKELVSWIIRFEHGDVGVLQTDERFRGRGFAKLVTQSICKRASDDGEDILVFIVPGNTTSERLFMSLGAKYVGSHNWLEYASSKNKL